MFKFNSLLKYLILFALCFPALLFSQTADHSKFEQLQQNFQQPEEVTKACLSCHNLAGGEIMKTSHWLWARETDQMPGREGETVKAGKINVINNFCVAIPSNEPRCNSCHIGYGWRDQNFDFTDQTKIDCLVCHESTGTYEKFPTAAGYPVSERTFFRGSGKWFDPPDYPAVARSVGRPSRDNCGSCHFYGGGGNAVKHGALDKSLHNPTRDIDVHMGSDGGNMVCVDCHVSVNHDIKGQLYSVASEDKDRIHCEGCHTVRPHTQKLFVEEFKVEGHDIFKEKLYNREKPDASFTNRILDKHTDRIACQTCHISEYSTEYKTKIWWDWSTAGKKNEEGGPLIKRDEDGDIIYDGRKGDFIVGRNLEPEYYWFNGYAGHVLVGDKIDPDAEPLELNPVQGVCGEDRSKIWPFKIMRGKQPYDPVEKTLIVPKLFGPPGSGAYWSDWDWDKAAEVGMKAAGVRYSGEIDWIETKMYWPITHLVRDKSQALECGDCHSRDGRLAGLEACWIPGRDRSLFLDALGMMMFFGSIIGVGVHGLIRFKRSLKNNEEEEDES